MAKKQMIKHYNNFSLSPITEIIDGICYKEEWKFIKGYKGKYEVSTFGRIKSLKREVKINHGVRCHPEKIMKQHLIKNGYCAIKLPIKKIGTKRYKGYLVHRLVAQAFIPNPNNKCFVNHMLGIKYFNHISNLEWVTISENSKHSYALGLQTPNITCKARPVVCTKTNKVYRSINYAASELGINMHTLFNQLKGRCKNKTSLIFKK